jgi:drug/metabolite transporter (DMT)-like permease
MHGTANAQENLVFELALLALLAALWGSSYLLIKVAVGTIPPVTLIAIRVSLAAVLLIAIVRLQNARLPKDTQTRRLLLIQALLGSVVPWTLLAWGQQYIDSGLAGVLNSTSPIFVFLLALLVTRHEAVTPWKLAGALLGVVGVALIMGVDVLRGLGQQVAGQAAVLLSAFLFALAAIHGKHFASIPATVTAAGTMVWSSVCLIPLSLAVDQPWMLEPSALSIAAAAALGIFNTGVAMLIYFRLVRTLGPMGVASQSYLRIGVSVLLGVVVLGEQVTPEIGLGLAAIVLGVLAINLRPRRGE